MDPGIPLRFSRDDAIRQGGPLAFPMMRAYTRFHVRSLHLHHPALGITPHDGLL